MRFFGKDLNEKVVVTRGYLLGISGMMLVLAGMILGNISLHASFEIVGLLISAVGLICLVVSLIFKSRGGDWRMAGETQTPNGN